MAYHAYAMYARTNGITNDTQLMAVRVKWLELLLCIVSDDAGSISEG